MPREKAKQETAVNPLTKKLNNPTLRSEAAQELINRQGGFIEQRALLFFVIVILLLVAGTWFIRYPDIIHANASLTARNAPKEVVGFQTGKLVGLFVKNGDHVHRGQMLGWVESIADPDQVISLSKIIDSCTALVSANEFESIPALLAKRYTHLGELQSPYQVFVAALQEYNDYWVNGYYTRKKQMLKNDMASLNQMNGLILQQKQLSMKDRDSAKRSLEMNKYLLDEKVISPEEYRTEVSKYNSKQLALPQYDQSILSNATMQREKRKEIEQIAHDEQQQKIKFAQALQTFKSSVDDWLHQYTIRAPADGKIDFTIPLQQNKYIEAGRVIAFVNPQGIQYYAEMYLPQNNFGKIDSGMQVQLRFAAWPYQEAGFIKAGISYISPIATDSGFLAHASLKNGLVSSQGRQFQYKNGLKAEALIITKDMRLLQRIYYNIVKSFSPK